MDRQTGREPGIQTNKHTFRQTDRRGGTQNEYTLSQLTDERQDSQLLIDGRGPLDDEGDGDVRPRLLDVVEEPDVALSPPAQDGPLGRREVLGHGNFGSLKPGACTIKLFTVSIYGFL